MVIAFDEILLKNVQKQFDLTIVQGELVIVCICRVLVIFLHKSTLYRQFINIFDGGQEFFDSFFVFSMMMSQVVISRLLLILGQRQLPLDSNTGDISAFLCMIMNRNTINYIVLKFGGDMMTSSPLKPSPNGQKCHFTDFLLIYYIQAVFSVTQC